MAKIQCYNCRRETPIVAPNYRCKHCNYPLNKYIQSQESPNDETIIDNPDLPDSQALIDNSPPAVAEPKAADLTLNDLFQKNVDDSLRDIKEVLSQLKPDEKIESSETGPVILKQNKNPEKNGKIVAGWLVVHTEKKLPVTYELFEGDNIIGRPDGPHQVDVRIEDDEYVSRVHALIRIKKDFLYRFSYELLDDGSLRRGSSSTNGTYINGQEERLPREKTVFLRDGDTIQVGTTKLVFKNIDQTDDLHDAAHSVLSTDFTNTVAIRR